VGGELLGRSGGVGAHQHRHLAGLVAGALRGGQLGERGVKHDDMIGGGVRACFARSQQLADRFPTTAVTVIDEPEQGVKSESLLPGPGRVLFLGVRGDQGGVEIDHYLSVLDRGPGVMPDPFPRTSSSGADRGEGVVSVRGQATDQPGHRRVRRDRAEHPGLGAQHRDIAGGVPAERDRDRQIGHDLPRIMPRERQPPRPEQPRQPLGQTAAPGGLDQQHPTRVRHQRLAAGDHGQPGTQVFMLHPRSASQLDPMWSRQPTSNRAEQALSRIQGPRVTYKINLVKARG
jgi:hypothetical protein